MNNPMNKHEIEEIFGVGQFPKPPLGVKPRSVFLEYRVNLLEHRVNELTSAIYKNTSFEMGRPHHQRCLSKIIQWSLELTNRLAELEEISLGCDQ